MGDARSSRDRQHDWGSREQPCQSQLRWGSFQLRGHLTDGAAPAGDSTSSQWEPWNKTHVLFFAILQDVFRCAVSHTVTILHAHDRNNCSGVLNLAHAYFRQTDVFDFPLCLQISQSAELIFSRHLGIDSMQLIEIDPVEAQPAQAAFAGRSQVFGAPILHPYIRTGPVEAAL